MARMIEIVPADDMYVLDLDELHDVAMGYIEAPGSIDVPAMIDSLVEAMFREETMTKHGRVITESEETRQ